MQDLLCSVPINRRTEQGSRRRVDEEVDDQRTSVVEYVLCSRGWSHDPRRADTDSQPRAKAATSGARSATGRHEPRAKATMSEVSICNRRIGAGAHNDGPGSVQTRRTRQRAARMDQWRQRATWLMDERAATGCKARRGWISCTATCRTNWKNDTTTGRDPKEKNMDRVLNQTI